MYGIHSTVFQLKPCHAILGFVILNECKFHFLSVFRELICCKFHDNMPLKGFEDLASRVYLFIYFSSIYYYKLQFYLCYTFYFNSFLYVINVTNIRNKEIFLKCHLIRQYSTTYTFSIK